LNSKIGFEFYFLFLFLLLSVVEDKPHKPVKRNNSNQPLVLPSDEEGAMVTCCGAQEEKKSKGMNAFILFIIICFILLTSLGNIALSTLARAL
jgi:hypothetical protein